MGRVQDAPNWQPAIGDGYLRSKPRCLAKRRKPDHSFEKLGLRFRSEISSLKSQFMLRQLSLANPVGVELLTAWLVGAFVSVSTEVVSLSLQQVRWQAASAVAVVVGQS